MFELLGCNNHFEHLENKLLIPLHPNHHRNPRRHLRWTFHQEFQGARDLRHSSTRLGKPDLSPRIDLELNIFKT